jgi:hypothetical protein
MTRHKTAAPGEGDDGTADVGGRRERTKEKREGWRHSCWLGASPLRLRLTSQPTTHMVRFRINSEVRETSSATSGDLLHRLFGSYVSSLLVQAYILPLQVEPSPQPTLSRVAPVHEYDGVHEPLDGTPTGGTHLGHALGHAL